MQPMKTSQFNVTLRSNTTKAITNSKQNKIDHEGQDNRILVLADKETNQLNLSDCPRDSLRINSITNSTICFDPSHTHRWVNRQ